MGGAVLVVPAGEKAAEVLPRVDALVLSGGTDDDPARYGAAREPTTAAGDPARDATEAELCLGALAVGVPVLAICRGMQLVDVALGGTVVQHLPARVGHTDHAPGPATYGTTRVTLAEPSLPARVAGATALEVPCHHQAIERCAPARTAVAWSADGTVEAVEMPGRPLLGVQWHPEERDDPALFAWLANAATARCVPGS